MRAVIEDLDQIFRSERSVIGAGFQCQIVKKHCTKNEVFH